MMSKLRRQDSNKNAESLLYDVVGYTGFTKAFFSF
jgi:hypothetical protein